ncbi:unnamed protein product (macronuclear) [Paramecium tetraurelia]|uniref:Transmembrane protein n=1 Tax=Paramecium tetraurelia TaxID=5888 RepID=A0D8I1_PARTE|nr:uncharacterized protein GSPATT00014294001 [Paramecium tetraurelia]CAK79348.1 unnamed protein product [Paramecium tetraurelia]|eukprot:XP_001446745.1 hypothetical protein (macronuclear) [Paramecium tetraurelia strain d4-2]
MIILEIIITQNEYNLKSKSSKPQYKYHETQKIIFYFAIYFQILCLLISHSFLFLNLNEIYQENILVFIKIQLHLFSLSKYLSYMNFPKYFIFNISLQQSVMENSNQLLFYRTQINCWTSHQNWLYSFYNYGFLIKKPFKTEIAFEIFGNQNKRNSQQLVESCLYIWSSKQDWIKQLHILIKILLSNLQLLIDLDLLNLFLKFDHRVCLTAAQALQHSYLQILHSEVDDVYEQALFYISQHLFQSIPWNFEQLFQQNILDMLYEEILFYHFSQFRNQQFETLQSDQSLISHIVDNENARIVDQNADE